MQITIKVPLTDDTDVPYTIRDIIRIDYITSGGFRSQNSTQLTVYHKNTASNQKTLGQLFSLVKQAAGRDTQVVFRGKLNLGDLTFNGVWVSDYQYDIEKDYSVTTLRTDYWTLDTAANTK